jgi:hypothetical protein
VALQSMYLSKSRPLNIYFSMLDFYFGFINASVKELEPRQPDKHPP